MDKSTSSAASKKLKSRRASKAEKTMASLTLLAAKEKKAPRIFGTAPQIARIAELESQLSTIRSETIKECAEVADDVAKHFEQEAAKQAAVDGVTEIGAAALVRLQNRRFGAQKAGSSIRALSKTQDQLRP